MGRHPYGCRPCKKEKQMNRKMKNTYLNKIRGCIVGGAAGDGEACPRLTPGQVPGAKYARITN